MEIIFSEPLHRNYEECLHNLSKGTIITGIPSHPDSVYMIVNIPKPKRLRSFCTGKPVSIELSHDEVLLFNLRSSTFRVAIASIVVIVLDGTLTVSKTIRIENYLK